ncbi:MAG: MtrB/PioB family decaheme-associated outer membrane protein [Betaproteobacteria bacterium]|nr:MtrB/PioB family decaheme-associated outer membrane protein [Betaproteobacteria bacterium]
MSSIVPVPSRTPTGRLYDPPWEIPQALPVAGDWNYRLSAEAGAVHGSSRAPSLHDYGDYGSGLVLNDFRFALDQGAPARYLDVTAGAVGRDDQHFRASFGRNGDFRTSLYFSQIPKLFTDRARTVFQGAGSGNLTLPAGLVPGNNTPAQLAAALEPAPFFELGFTRKTAGLDFDATPGTDWRLYARYAQDRKTGTRPSGGASGYPGAPAVETIEPLDYKTHNVSAGLQWVRDAHQANLGYSGSFFRNGIDTLSWENPLTLGDPAVLQRSRVDLYPDNSFHNLKLDASAALPLRGRLSGGLSWSRMSQDDALIAHTVNSGILGGVNLANWNTTAALSRASAGARIDTRLIHLSGAFSPLRDLSLQARLRRYEEDNKTRYIAFNPLTGQSGYIGLDGANNVNIVPGLFRVPVHSIPFEHRKDSYGVEGDYRLLRRTSVTLGYEREINRHPHREHARTDEERFRAALNNRDIPWATIRLTFEHATRSGDNYNFDPNQMFYSGAALINAPATLAELRKYDVADRTQRILNGRVNFLVARDMDLAVAGRRLENDYGAAYGRLGERITAFNLEWNWQPRPAASAYAHYGFERRHNRMAQISDDPAGWGTGNPNAGGAAYPLANRWEEGSRDDAHTVGLGFRYAFSRATLETGYTYLYSPYRTRYSFASAGALAGGAAAAAGAGDGMPDMVFRQQAVETSLKLAIDKHAALRLYHRYERTRLEDWHYDGLSPVFAGGAGVFLDAGPRSHSGNLFGVFLQYTPGRAGK